MDKYLQEVIEREKKRLSEHIHYAMAAYNSIKKDPLHCVITASIPNYKSVLVVEFKSGRTGYINIDANSVLATARELANYLYNGSDRVGGFIKEVYS